jgi:hypothetical protein
VYRQPLVLKHSTGSRSKSKSWRDSSQVEAA